MQFECKNTQTDEDPTRFIQAIEKEIGKNCGKKWDEALPLLSDSCGTVLLA